MRRVLAGAFVAGLVAVLGAAPALAKPGEAGFGEATGSVAISGPGLSGPVPLDRAATASYEDLSNVFSPTSRMDARPTRVDLGARYDLLFTITCTEPSGTRTVSVRQDLYPYASFAGAAQVWTYTPAGQATCLGGDRVAAGWNAARRGLFDTLLQAGLPGEAPAPAPGPAPATPDAGLFWPVFGLVAGLTVLTLAAILVGRAGRRARVLG